MLGQGIPSHWQTYVSVDNLEEALKKASDLGGNVVMPAMDVMEAGRMSPVQDPTGAVLLLWQSRHHKGAELYGEPGTLCWFELHTRDTTAAAIFYTRLFGWTTENGSMPGWEAYIHWRLDGEGIGGMMAIQKDWGEVPPNWVVYFAVETCDATVAKAQQLGAEVVLPAMDIPGTGRIAFLHDPNGAHFALYEPEAGGH